jgi:hypothetical protein
LLRGFSLPGAAEAAGEGERKREKGKAFQNHRIAPCYVKEAGISSGGEQSGPHIPGAGLGKRVVQRGE